MSYDKSSIEGTAQIHQFMVLSCGIIPWNQLVDMTQWRIMFPPPELGWIIPQNFSVASFYLYAAPATVPSSPWFLSTVVPGYLQWKHFPVLLSWGSVWGALSLSGPDLVGPLLRQARVNKGFSVCLYAPGWWWGASHNHLLSHTGLVTLVTLSWGHSDPLRVISSAFLQCHCDNCHLHLKCYEWRPFAFLPSTMYLKYWRVHKLFN